MKLVAYLRVLAGRPGPMAAEGLSRFTYLVVDRSPFGGVAVSEALLLTGKLTTAHYSGGVAGRLGGVVVGVSVSVFMTTCHTPLG